MNKLISGGADRPIPPCQAVDKMLQIDMPEAQVATLRLNAKTVDVHRMGGTIQIIEHVRRREATKIGEQIGAAVRFCAQNER